MRITPRSVFLYRAVFGLGFIAFGAVIAYRVVVAPGPGNKTPGFLLAAAMIALGGVRIGQYVRARRAPPP